MLLRTPQAGSLRLVQSYNLHRTPRQAAGCCSDAVSRPPRGARVRDGAPKTKIAQTQAGQCARSGTHMFATRLPLGSVVREVARNDKTDGIFPPGSFPPAGHLAAPPGHDAGSSQGLEQRARATDASVPLFPSETGTRCGRSWCPRSQLPPAAGRHRRPPSQRRCRLQSCGEPAGCRQTPCFRRRP